MCFKSSETITTLPRESFKRPKNAQIHRLNRRRPNWRKVEERIIRMKTEMEIRNMKLMMENRSIMEANEKLRQRALILQQENQNLFSQLQKNLPSSPAPASTPQQQ